MRDPYIPLPEANIITCNCLSNECKVPRPHRLYLHYWRNGCSGFAHALENCVILDNQEAMDVHFRMGTIGRVVDLRTESEPLASARMVSRMIAVATKGKIK